MSNAWKVVQMLDAWSFDSRIQEIGADRVIKEAADEIEKLRAALRDIARQPEGDEESAQAVARAALGEKDNAKV